MSSPFEQFIDEAVAEKAVQMMPDYATGFAFDRTEPGNADRLHHYFGQDLRYVKELNRWRNWDGHRWNPSLHADMVHVARKVSRNIFAEASLAQTDDEARERGKFAIKSSSKSQMEAMLGIAIGDHRMWQELNDFDACPYLINFTDGTVDVRKKIGEGRIRPHDRLDFLTQLTPHKYNPEANCPKWKALVARTVKDANQDDETLRFLQKALGYSLLGGNPEHVIFFLTGPERCGKSKILEIVRELVSEEYSHISKPDLISKKRHGHHDSEMFSIVGKRIVLISEMSGSFAMDESQVKSLSGDPVNTARRLRDATEIQARTTWTIWLATNENPSVQNWDGAIQERVVVIPCGPTISPEERIPDLDRQIIEEEAEGVLAWLVEGAHMWWNDLQQSLATDGAVRTGLARPTSVRMANASYAEDNDYMGAYISEHLVVEEGLKTTKAAILDQFKRTRAPGERVRRNTLYERVAKLPGVTVDKIYFHGVGIRMNVTKTQSDWVSQVSGDHS